MMLEPPVHVDYQHNKKSKFRFNHNTPDDVWLAVAGQQGWVVFSHDRKFHLEEAERYAIRQFGVACFYLWGSNASTFEKMRSFCRGYDRIVEAATNTARPFIFDVQRDGRLVPIKIP